MYSLVSGIRGEGCTGYTQRLPVIKDPHFGHRQFVLRALQPSQDFDFMDEIYAHVKHTHPVASIAIELLAVDVFAHISQILSFISFQKSVLALPSVKVRSAEIARGQNLVAFSVTPAAGARWNYY